MDMNSTIKVYKTNVADKSEAMAITNLLMREFPSTNVSFDLEDCDNVLRIEALNGSIDEQKVREILGKCKRNIEPLPF